MSLDIAISFQPNLNRDLRGAGYLLPGVWGCPPIPNPPKSGGKGVEKAPGTVGAGAPTCPNRK